MKISFLSSYFGVTSLLLVFLSSDDFCAFGFVGVVDIPTTRRKNVSSPLVFLETKTKATTRRKNSSTNLLMSKKNNNLFDFAEVRNGVLGLIVALLVFSGDLLPLLSGQLGSKTAPLAESVAFRNSDGTSSLVSTNTNVNPTMSDKYRLSRGKIQEKISAIPVFYVTLEDETIDGTNFYLSGDDAAAAADNSSSEKKVVKATTLDQVQYPLILRRGRMRMAPPPVEVSKAEANSDVKYTLIPSKQAIADAAEFNVKLAPNDFPLFLADRLAFSQVDGTIQVPLFLAKRDCITSYERLQKNSGNYKASSLPEKPILRVTTLNDELFSMEKGTRPGQTQLAVYATAEDVNKAIELFK